MKFHEPFMQCHESFVNCNGPNNCLTVGSKCKHLCLLGLQQPFLRSSRPTLSLKSFRRISKSCTPPFLFISCSRDAFLQQRARQQSRQTKMRKRRQSPRQGSRFPPFINLNCAAAQSNPLAIPRQPAASVCLFVT